MWFLLLAIIGVARVFVAPFILLFPIAISVLSTFLDAVDGFVAFRAGLTHHTYHMYDKLLDYWWYIFIVLYCVDLPIFPVIFILFVYRTAGQIASLSLGNGLSFMWFPNILENYFFGYLLSTFIPILKPLYVDTMQILTIIICAILAINREYFIHVQKRNVANRLFHTNMHWEFNDKKKKKHR